ncbi:MAG TPA: hypothetical protein VGK68_00250 [Gaiellaceae bacterium]
MTRMDTTVWNDPELTGLIADDPELAAIADALLATAPTTAGRRRRRLPVRLGLLAAALAGVVALVLSSPWSGGGPALADRALAALGGDPVLHVAVQRPSSIRYVDLATGAPRRLFERQEIWYDRGRSYVHTVTRAPDGSLLDDDLATPQGDWTLGGPTPSSGSGPVPTVDPALGAFLDGYQHALADGEATETGAGTLGGTQVIWFSFPYGRETESVAVDASTYRPLFVRDASGTSRYRVVSIETVAKSAANFERPTPTEAGREMSSGVRVDRSQLAVDPTEALQALPRAIWLGRSFQDLPLGGIEREGLNTTFTDPQLASETGVGLALVYGPTASPGVPDRTKPFVQLWESDQPQLAYQWGLLRGIVPPDGVLATAGSGVFGPTGFLVRDGIYITVTASSPELALEAARALSPISSS